MSNLKLLSYNATSPQKVNFDAISEEAIVVRYKTWYQVYNPEKTYGFSVVDGFIYDHPDRRFEGKNFDITKAKFEIIKIAEQILI